MSDLYPAARLLWSLTSSGPGTTLSAAGNSGNWAGNGAGDLFPAADNETPVLLRDVTDVVLMVTVGGVTSSPSLKVGLDFYDDLGNVFANALQTAAITGAGATSLAGGLHGYSSATYLVLPKWGRVNWTISGGTVTGTEIALYGR